MKLLKELRKKYMFDQESLMSIFGCKSRQHYYAIENLHKRFTIKQFLTLFDVFTDATGQGAPEFLEKLRKEK
jgi:hypothetical protein